MSASNKKSFYAREEVASGYDDWRFGGAGGELVNRLELDGVLALLDGVPRSGSVADIPIGTGRLSAHLLANGFQKVVGADFSSAMLSLAAGNAPGVMLSRQDAHATAFAAGSFDAAVSLRFSFHTEKLNGLLGELSRVVKLGGVVVIDTLRWSPRSFVTTSGQRLGGRLFVVTDDAVRRAAAEAGLEAEATRPMFLLPSYAYRLLPAFTVRALAKLEPHLPGRAMSKVLWRFRKKREP